MCDSVGKSPPWRGLDAAFPSQFILGKKAEIRRSFITTTGREQNPRSQGATGRVRTGDQRYPILCHCQLGTQVCSKIIVTPGLA